MKRVLFSVLAWVLFSISSVAVATAVDAPEYKNNDRWRVRWQVGGGASRSDTLPNGIYNILYCNGKFLWYPEGPNGSRCEAGSNDAWEGLREEDAIVFYGSYKEVPYLSFPLNASGKPREYRYYNPKAWANLDGTITVTRMTVVPTEVKKLKLPSYEHTAYETGGRAKREYTYYYAPACKCIALLDAAFGSGTTYHLVVLDYDVK